VSHPVQEDKSEEKQELLMTLALLFLKHKELPFFADSDGYRSTTKFLSVKLIK